MHIFINNTTLHFVNNDNLGEDFNLILNPLQEEIDFQHLEGKILAEELTEKFLRDLTYFLLNESDNNSFEIYLQSELIERFTSFFTTQFKILNAAGGIVQKKGKILLIHRLGRWDLPKGKLEEEESFLEAAQREVEEECNVKTKIEAELVDTWHHYELKGKQILKKTAWYQMICTDDSQMKPQTEEDIQEIRWFDVKDLGEVWQNTYPAIAFTLQKFLKNKKASKK